MQSKVFDIYTNVSKKTDIPLNEIKQVGDIIFKNILSKIKNPTNLILKIRWLGSFYLRKKRLEKELQIINKRIISPKRYESLSLEEREYHKELIQNRLNDYKEYTYRKKEVKKVRHENSKLIKSSIQKEYVY